MPEDAITYEYLYEALRKEKTQSELQVLDKNFYRSVLSYLKEKAGIIQKHSQDLMFVNESKKIQRELDNVKKLIRELCERRESKILQLAVFSSRSGIEDIPKSVLPEEKLLFHDSLNTLNAYLLNVIENILSMNPPSMEEKPKDIKTELEKPMEKNKLIRLLHPIPKFVGSDLQVYGPFEKEDVSNLPEKIADILISKNRAMEIKNETGKENPQVLS